MRSTAQQTGRFPVRRNFQPRYVNSTYKDFKLFMPYSELHMAVGKHDLKFNVQIFDKGTGAVFEFFIRLGTLHLY